MTPRQRPVVRVGPRTAQDVGHAEAGLVHRDVGEGALPGHVPDRPDARDHLHAAVDGKTAGILVQAERTHPQRVQVAAAPGGDEHAFALQRGAVGQDDLRARRPVGLHALDGNARVDVHAVAPQDLGDQRGGLGLFGAGQARGRLDDGDGRAEALHDLTQLEANGASADHEEGRGHRLGLDQFAVRPVRHGLEHRRHPGPLPRRQHQRTPRRDGGAIDLDAGQRPSRAAFPRTKRAPLPSRRSTATRSSHESVTSRTRRATGAQSGVTSADPARPGMRHPSASRSPARTIALEGMQPQ